MITIVIPMAGAGSRFVKAGYTIPKPFINIKGRMMIEHVLDGVALKDARYILVIQKKFIENYNSYICLIKNKYNATFITVNGLTQGASCTALAAHNFIDIEKPVVFVDSDNIFDNNSFKKFILNSISRNLDGSLLTFKSSNPCFSFAEIDINGFVIKTKEKQVISEHAIAGAYFFNKGKYFIDNTIEMLIYGDKIKNEFYMSNVFNYAISNNLKIGIFDIDDDKLNCVGTPEQLMRYINA